MERGKIFISHSSSDKRIARRLARRLEGWGYAVWLDEKELRLGDPLSQGIAGALAVTPVLIALISKHSIKSRWVEYELNQAVERQIKGSGRVIPLRIDGVPVPPVLSGVLYGDLGSNARGTYARLRRTLEAIPGISREQQSPYLLRKQAIEDVFGPVGYVLVRRGGEFTYGRVVAPDDRQWVLHYDCPFSLQPQDAFDVYRFIARCQEIEQIMDFHAHLVVVEDDVSRPLDLSGSHHSFSLIAPSVWEALQIDGLEWPLWVVTDHRGGTAVHDSLGTVEERCREALLETEVVPLIDEHAPGPFVLVIDI